MSRIGSGVRASAPVFKKKSPPRSVRQHKGGGGYDIERFWPGAGLTS